MYRTIQRIYEACVLKRPVLALLLSLAVIAGFGFFAKDFRLDASADSLLLEHDKDLKYYRSVTEQYGSDEFLIISYTPTGDLFAPETLAELGRLREKLLQLERVEKVVSILDVPLIDSPRLTLGEMKNGVRTLEAPDTDVELARQEFLTSPLYSNLIVSPDARTTALQVIFERDENLQQLLRQRTQLRQKQLDGSLTAEEARQLDDVSAKYDQVTLVTSEEQKQDIAAIRTILADHRQSGELFLGGVPMIVTDMIDFIRHDLAAFGIGVLLFLVSMLALIFRYPRWVILPMVCCSAAVLFMFGLLGLIGWKVTVVSSNFTSLMLIITLSLCVHLMVRYNEAYAELPGADQLTLVREMVRSKAVPSIYTSLTTIVGFASLMISDLRPIIDFGWMMAIGISAALLISFVIFPASLMLFKPVHFSARYDLTGSITRFCARIVERHGKATLAVFALLAVITIVGINQLTVENRFIDNFKSTTEIYQGMLRIDRQLGGTVPLDVIIEADQEFLAAKQQQEAAPAAEKDPFADFDEPQAEEGLSGSSYWYNSYQIDKLQQIHDYLDQLPESGKVMSMATTFSLMRQVNDDQPLDNISLAVIHKKLPEQIEQALFAPYMAKDGNQVRFSLRVIESDPNLRRNALVKKVRADLLDKFDLKPEQLKISGIFVLYNNVLQSLYRSQVMTIGMVFLAIMGMFLLQFRSLRLAIISIIPNLFSAGIVLGLMGLLGIPLDIMTITIAAITIGIAVDDTIHYVHRFNEELAKDGDYLGAMKRSHDSVGRAMYYTSITVIVGFSILTLSSFMPTIYFGLFTGLAMAVAMFANLTLLALLLLSWRPRGAKV